MCYILILFYSILLLYTQMLVVFMALISWSTNVVTLYLRNFKKRRGGLLSGPTLRGSDFVDCGFLMRSSRLRTSALMDQDPQLVKHCHAGYEEDHSVSAGRCVHKRHPSLEGERERSHIQLVRSEKTSWKEGKLGIWGQALTRESSHRRLGRLDRGQRQISFLLIQT